LEWMAAARGCPLQFCLWAGVHVDTIFGTADVDTMALQVDALWTSLGVQASSPTPSSSADR